MTIVLVIISLSILIFIHELGHFLFAKLFRMPVEEFCIGFPPRILKWKRGETVYSIGAVPFGGFVKITGENGDEDSFVPVLPDVPRLFSNFGFFQKSAVILAGVSFNIIGGYLALAVLFTTGIPRHLLISGVAPDSPAEMAGLKSGDIIVRAEHLEDPILTASFIEFTSQKKGSEIPLEVLRGKERLSVRVAPRSEVPQGEGALGVELVEIGFDGQPFPQNIAVAGQATLENLIVITQSFFGLITGIFARPEIAEGVTGPVGIFGIATQAGNLGVPYLVQLMALISLNLAILNLIPFPALDGGRFLFLCIEKIIRRPLSWRVQNVANAAGFVILIFLMILITIQDIGNIVS